MEPEQPDPTPPRPRRRWYQDLSQKFKQGLTFSSTPNSPTRTPNPPLQPSSARSANIDDTRPSLPNSSHRASSVPSRRSDSRPSAPALARPPSPGIRNAAWRALENTLKGLQVAAETVPPLKSAIDGLVSLLGAFEASNYKITAAKNRGDYEKLANDLEITAEFLNQHLKGATAGPMKERILNIAQSIENEIKSIEMRQNYGATGRVLGPHGDEEDVIGRYRRIEQLLHRIQIEASMSTWVIANEQLANTRLGELAPAKLASYNSKLSTSINRRTCTEDTRKGILADLNIWSDNTDAKKVYWMDGMAGTGKTTIACTLASQLESRGQLAASFFCTRTSPECRDADRIVPTIAYQLARRSTAFKSALCQVLDKDPDIGSQNIFTQFKRLLKEPLQEVKDKMGNNLVVVIDALDECTDPQIVGQILDVLFRFVDNLPIKFFVTSRPEAIIREKMMSSENSSRSILHLHDIEQSLVQKDIELYLEEELKSISPSPDDVKQLATLAGKLFIYAATAVRYITMKSKGAVPRDRLAIMLSVDSKSKEKHTQIDSLYTAILGAVLEAGGLEPEERERMERVIWTAVCAREPISVETMAALVESNEDQALAALEPFRSVLHVSEHTGLVSTLHASFPDYILSQTRSGGFFCDVGTHSQLLGRRCLEIMKGQLRFNVCNLPSSFLPDSDVPDLDARIETNISSSLSYACRYWPEHLILAMASDELRAMVDEFLSQRLLFWMEVLNLKQCMAMGTQGLVKVQKWLRTTDGSSDSVLARDAHKFVSRFASHSTTLSTPHIYISALPLCPPSSLVSVRYRRRMQGLMEVKGTAIVRLGEAALATWTTDSRICCVAYSPDGTHVVSGDSNGMICVRNVQNGKVVVGPFKAHYNNLLSIMYSPDGNRIVSGSLDRTIRVWDARDGTPVVGPFTDCTDVVHSVAFSPDGTRIVSGSYDRIIRVWDARNGTLAASPFHGHTSTVNSVGYSPDGRCVVSGSYDCTIRTWDVNTGSHIHLFEGHTKSVTSVGFSPDGECIVSGSDDCTIRVWNVCDGTLAIVPFEGHTYSVVSVAYSSNGALIVSGSRDRTIRVWSAHDGTLAAGPFEGHTDIISSVQFSPDGAQIVSGSDDKSISIWNVSDSPLAAPPPKGHSSAITSAEFSPDGSLIATGSWDRTIRVWSAVDGSYVAGPFEGHTGSVNSVAFSPDSTRIASGSDDHIRSDDYTIRVWHAHNGTLLVGPIQGHTRDVRSVAFSPDGSRIASGSYDKTICLWDSSNGTVVAGPFKGHIDSVLSVAFSPNGAYIASGSEDRTIRIWNSFNGNQITNPIEGHTRTVESVCFSHDGSRIVSGSYDKTVCIWSVPNGQLIAGPFKGHTGYVLSVAFSPDSTLVVSGSVDCTIRLWNADGTLAAPPLLGHTDSVNAVSFSPNGSSVLSCSYDRSIRVWDILHKQRICTALAGDWEIHNDGWVFNARSQMLFWLPAELCSYFPRLNNRFTIGTQGSIQAGFDDMLLGEEWDSSTHVQQGVVLIIFPLSESHYSWAWKAADSLATVRTGTVSASSSSRPKASTSPHQPNTLISVVTLTVAHKRPEFLSAYGCTLNAKDIDIEHVQHFLNMFGPRQVTVCEGEKHAAKIAVTVVAKRGNSAEITLMTSRMRPGGLPTRSVHRIGEKWPDVALILSTASLQLGSALTSWQNRIPVPIDTCKRANPRVSGADMAESEGAFFSDKEGIVECEHLHVRQMQGAEPLRLTLACSALLLIYMDVAIFQATRATTRLSLSLDLQADLDSVCVPREKNSVFLTCKVMNVSEFTLVLLQGEASIL
ncbi:Vegetative incompatibility protein HET-E-1 [Ceratobasidium theobromae]|uniref:Vegetative incompatibility protein HET-E-1 n=1 Tax=Ceratobasidium theobromae TaxID=1582974 RepID=A0A5N5QA89_9AGAM|nr:Vegetative incompatibility protein HET-E-1 [Ceratobasidium theobromae]